MNVRIDIEIDKTFQPDHLGGFQIFQRAPQRTDGGQLVLQLQRRQGLFLKVAQHTLGALLHIKLGILAHIHRHFQTVGDKRLQRLIHGSGGIEQNFAGIKPSQFIANAQLQIVAGKTGDMHLTRRAIAKAQSRLLLSGIHKHCRQVVVAGFVQHAPLNDRSGRDDAHNVALHQSLCGRGVLRLLTDRHLIAALHQTGDIGLAAVERHTAHRRAFFHAAILARQRQFQFAGRNFRVLKEHFIEIAQAEKENTILVLLLDLQILLHHRRKICHADLSSRF